LASDLKTGSFERIYGVPVPMYLTNVQELGNLSLVIILMIMATQEPIFWCAGASDKPEDMLYSSCDGAKDVIDAYSGCSCIAMLLYFILLTDFTIFSMRISAFLLVCGRVMSELGLFLLALAFLIVAFSSAISSLNQTMPSFNGIERGALTLLQMALSMYPTSLFGDLHAEPWAMLAVAVFIIMVAIFLLNLLVAQLNQAYQLIFADMQGYARLNRAAVTVKTLEQVSDKRWGKFLATLKLDERLEFNEGDIGLAGGLQVTEASNLNPTTVDAIRRFGGSTSPAMPWPAEDGVDNGDDDKFDRLEKLIVRATKGMSGGKKKGGGSSSGGGSGSGGGGSAGEEAAEEGSE